MTMYKSGMQTRLTSSIRWEYLFVASTILLLCSSIDLKAQWTSDKGKAWLDLSSYYHDTRTQFWFDGTEIELFEEGHIVTSATFLTGSVGLSKGLDAWIQIPFVRSQFDDIAGQRTSQGLGDPRFYIRADPQLFGFQTIPMALRLGFKAPIGSFETDAEIVPLGDGQLDLEAILELGYSSPTGNLYTLFWIGYRWRFENEESLFLPGNEISSLLKVGAKSGKLSANGSLELLNGTAPRSQGLEISSGKKELLQFSPSIGYDFGQAVLNLGLRHPINGRNFASGTSIFASLFMPLAL